MDIDHILSVHSSVSGHWGWFHLFVFVPVAAVNVGLQTSALVPAFDSFGYLESTLFGDRLFSLTYSDHFPYQQMDFPSEILKACLAPPGVVVTSSRIHGGALMFSSSGRPYAYNLKNMFNCTFIYECNLLVRMQTLQIRFKASLTTSQSLALPSPHTK